MSLRLAERIVGVPAAWPVAQRRGGREARLAGSIFGANSEASRDRSSTSTSTPSTPQISRAISVSRQLFEFAGAGVLARGAVDDQDAGGWVGDFEFTLRGVDAASPRAIVAEFEARIGIAAPAGWLLGALRPSHSCERRCRDLSSDRACRRSAGSANCRRNDREMRLRRGGRRACPCAVRGACCAALHISPSAAPLRGWSHGHGRLAPHSEHAKGRFRAPVAEW